MGLKTRKPNRLISLPPGGYPRPPALREQIHLARFSLKSRGAVKRPLPETGGHAGNEGRCRIEPQEKIVGQPVGKSETGVDEQTQKKRQADDLNRTLEGHPT